MIDFLKFFLPVMGAVVVVGIGTTIVMRRRDTSRRLRGSAHAQRRRKRRMDEAGADHEGGAGED